MSSKVKIIGAAVILAALCFLLGRWTAPQHGPVEAESIKVDTLVVRDTITRYRPEYRTNYVRDSIFVTLTPYQLAKVVLENGIPYDQMILYPSFLHLSFRKEGEQRMQLLYNASYRGKRFAKV